MSLVIRFSKYILMRSSKNNIWKPGSIKTGSWTEIENISFHFNF